MGEWDFPALPLLQYHPHLQEKEALMSPTSGESPEGCAGSAALSCFPPFWHLPGGEVLPSQHSQPQEPCCPSMSLRHRAHPKASQVPGMDTVLCPHPSQSNGQ